MSINIQDITTEINSVFNIEYESTLNITKHELSIDNGLTFKIIAPTKFENRYTYTTNLPRIGLYNCLIRVTVDEQIILSNNFNIRVEYSNIPEFGINGKAQNKIDVYKGNVKLIGVDGIPSENQFNYSFKSMEGCIAKRKDSDSFYIESMYKNSGKVEVLVNCENKITLTKTMTITKVTNGSTATSPITVSILGQQTMKYVTSNTPPIPSTSNLVATLNEGNMVVESGVTYIWQYKNHNGSWGNLPGLNRSNSYTLSHDNVAFINDVAQIRVGAIYKNNTYYDEFTVTKIYDNKYITQEEIFNKLTNNSQEQGLYMQDGKIYLNMTYAKTGQLLADLIRGGVLTLGGSIGTDNIPTNGYMRVLAADNKTELANLNGGDMSINGLSSDEATIDKLYVNEIISPKITPMILEDTTIYVNRLYGDDDNEFLNGAKFKTFQGAINAIPKNLNGFTVSVRIENTRTDSTPDTYSQNIFIRGFYGGTFNIYLQKNSLYGNIRVQDCSARLFIVGGSTWDDISDGLDKNERADIKPSSLINVGGNYYSIVVLGCQFVYIKSVDIWGKTDNTNNYCIGSRDGSNVFVKNVKAYSSKNGFHAQTMGRLVTDETYGRVEQWGYRCTYGGWMNISTGYATSGAVSNISKGDGCEILQGTITWDGTSTTGSNNNTTSNNETSTYTSTSGDSYKVKYSSWRKDNTVRQGDWSGTGMHKGCWFFGNQFNEVKGKAIKSVKLTLKRQSSGGNSGAVTFTLKMHNYASRPSGNPSYLSTWSKTVSLSYGQSTSITITDAAVLNAINAGTMKGFGIETSGTSNSYYGILNPSLKAVVTYS